MSQAWTESRATAWYQNQPWLVGCNYLPASAINQLEMWQAESFDPEAIDRELGWAEDLGMNTLRVFLHDLLWGRDAEGFNQRIDRFLRSAESHRIRPMFVLFDSCWDPAPQLGPQRAPTPGVHNCGWVKSPGLEALRDAAQYPRLEAYVKGVVGAFAADDRILAWDVWNEPDNLDAADAELVCALLPRAFDWARAVGPRQPLTCGLWGGGWRSAETMKSIERIQLDQSDILSFHNYNGPEDFESCVRRLQAYRRPVLCSEYMARSNGSTFQGILPVAKEYGVAAYNWGFVAGKSQTYYPWDSWLKPYTDHEPDMWFHDVLQPDGTPYREEEAQFIRRITGRQV